MYKDNIQLILFSLKVNTGSVLKCLLAEYIGTLLLVLIGCGSCTGGDPDDAGVQIDDQVSNKPIREEIAFILSNDMPISVLTHQLTYSGLINSNTSCSGTI